MPKSLRYRKCIYLTNSLGEETGHEAIPQAVMDWYKKVSMGTSDPFWLEYLVRLDGRYGIALVQEVAHTACDNNDEYDGVISESSGAALQRIEKHAVELDKLVGDAGAVYVGQETGIYGRHELVVLVLFDAIPAVYEVIRESLGGHELAIGA